MTQQPVTDVERRIQQTLDYFRSEFPSNESPNVWDRPISPHSGGITPNDLLQLSSALPAPNVAMNTEELVELVAHGMCYIDTGDNYKTWLNDARRAVYVLLPHLKANVAPQGGSDIPAPPVKTPTQKLNDEMAIVDLMMRAYDNSGFCHIGTYSTPSAMRAVYRSVVAHLLTEPAKDVRELVEAAYREGIIDGIARQCDIHSLSQKEENALIKQAWGESEARHNLSRFAAKPEASVEGHHE